MNQPPDSGSQGGFGLGDARPPGVAMPGKTSEQYDNRQGNQVTRLGLVPRLREPSSLHGTRKRTLISLAHHEADAEVNRAIADVNTSRSLVFVLIVSIFL